MIRPDLELDDLNRREYEFWEANPEGKALRRVGRELKEIADAFLWRGDASLHDLVTRLEGLRLYVGDYTPIFDPSL